MERLPEVEQAAAPVDESFLSTLGIHRLPIPVPFMEAGGPVNACALENEDGTWTMFDTGVATDEGSAALRAGLAQQGIDVARISRIIVSHGHVDHYGNAQWLSEQSGARVFLHEGDLHKVCGDGRWFLQLEQHFDYYLKLGVPAATLEELLDGTKRQRSYATQVDRARVTLVESGSRWRFKHFEAELIHFPGHTPGLLCLYAAAQRLLLADDHLLARVSPNPLLDFEQGEGATKFRSLSRYLESAKKVYDLDLDCVVPGHGPSFRGHRPLLDGLFEFYGRRQKKLLDRLATAPATVYELVNHIFPRRDVPRMYLMLSEVLGNLEVLEDRGVVARDADFRFALTAAR